MKKIVLFAAIVAAAGLASCTAQAPKANMKSEIDSLSYMMGVSNTQGLSDFAAQRLGVDSAGYADFVRGIQDGIHKANNGAILNCSDETCQEVVLAQSLC